MQELLRQERRAAKRANRVPQHRQITDPEFVFFHLAKTGGGTVRSFLYGARSRWVPAGHEESLASIQERFPGVPMTFFVREPISRYVSTFNNFRRAVVQKAGGRLPSRTELIIYTLFPTANDLAEGLASDDPRLNSAACWAMERHHLLRHHLSSSLGGMEGLERYLPQIPLIGVFEAFDASLEAMRTCYDLPASLSVPDETSSQHLGLSHLSTYLSPTGRAAVAEWFSEDIELYQRCREIHDAQLREINK